MTWVVSHLDGINKQSSCHTLHTSLLWRHWCIVTVVASICACVFDFMSSCRSTVVDSGCHSVPCVPTLMNSMSQDKGQGHCEHTEHISLTNFSGWWIHMVIWRLFRAARRRVCVGLPWNKTTCHAYSDVTRGCEDVSGFGWMNDT